MSGRAASQLAVEKPDHWCANTSPAFAHNQPKSKVMSKGDYIMRKLHKNPVTWSPFPERFEFWVLNMNNTGLPQDAFPGFWCIELTIFGFCFYFYFGFTFNWIPRWKRSEDIKANLESIAMRTREEWEALEEAKQRLNEQIAMKRDQK